MRHPQLPMRPRVSAESAAANRRTVDALLRTSTIGDLPTQLANALQTGGEDTVNEVADLFQQLEARDPEISAQLGDGLASQLGSIEGNDGGKSKNPQVAFAPAVPLLGLLIGGGAAIGTGEILRRQYERRRRENFHNRPPALVPPPPLTPNRTPENQRPKDLETATRTPPQTQPPRGFTGTKGPIPEIKTPQVILGPSLDEITKEIPFYENRGNDLTKDEIDIVRDWFLGNNPLYEHKDGGREQGSGEDKKERQIPGPGIAFKHPITGKPGDSRPGSRFADLTFRHKKTGKIVHIQTVDIDKNGKVTADELEAAEAIRRASGATVLLIRKRWQVERLRRRRIKMQRRQRGIGHNPRSRKR
ncbi:MAG: hypothetical protein WD767_12425 [Alphaproteobacteria bacterium]